VLHCIGCDSDVVGWIGVLAFHSQAASGWDVDSTISVILDTAQGDALLPFAPLQSFSTTGFGRPHGLLNGAGVEHMPHDLAARLVDLQREFALGEEKLRELDAQQTRLRETMLRIQGAMQMLRELIDADGAGDTASLNESAPGNPRPETATAERPR